MMVGKKKKMHTTHHVKIIYDHRNTSYIIIYARLTIRYKYNFVLNDLYIYIYILCTDRSIDNK